MDRWARFASDGSDDLDQHGLVIFFLMGLLVMVPIGLNRSSDGSDSDFF